MTFERLAARWWARWVYRLYIDTHPDDPNVIRWRESCDRLKQAMVLDVRGVTDPVLRAKLGNERFGKRWVQIVYGDG